MEKILRQLYFGNLRPVEKSYPPHSAYGKAVQAVAACEEQLLAQLDGPQRELLNRYSQAEGTIQSIASEEMFAEGFRTGARLMLELLSEDPKMPRTPAEP